MKKPLFLFGILALLSAAMFVMSQAGQFLAQGRGDEHGADRGAVAVKHGQGALPPAPLPKGLSPFGNPMLG